MSQGRVEHGAGPKPETPVKASGAQMPRWLRLAGYITLGAAGSLAVALGAASYPLSGLLIRPRLKRLSQLKSSHLRHLMSRSRIPFEDVTIPSFDGTRLFGWWMSADRKAPTIVILHGVKKNRTDVLRAALVLRRAGFNVLLFDGRGHGYSEGRGRRVYRSEPPPIAEIRQVSHAR